MIRSVKHKQYHKDCTFTIWGIKPRLVISTQIPVSKVYKSSPKIMYKYKSFLRINTIRTQQLND